MSDLSAYLKKWELSEPEVIARTLTSDVYKVKFNNETAVLKILNEKGQKFESRGAEVLRCFNGPVPPDLSSMWRNFRSLIRRANSENEGAIFRTGAGLAREPIATARVLHGKSLSN